MSMSLDDITTMSRQVALQHGRGLDVLAVTKVGDDSERVEVLVTVRGCHTEPCRFLVNVTRADEEEFRRDFRLKLTDALQKHAAA